MSTSLTKTFLCATVLASGFLAASGNANGQTALATSTSVTVDQQSGPQGAVFTFTASVTDANGPLKFGIVNFYDEDATAPNALLSTVVLNQANGTATLRTNSFRIGTHNITARFVGTNTEAPSSASAPAISVTGEYGSQTTLHLVGTKTSPSLLAQVEGAALKSLSGTVTFTDMTAGKTLYCSEPGRGPVGNLLWRPSSFQQST